MMKGKVTKMEYGLLRQRQKKMMKGSGSLLIILCTATPLFLLFAQQVQSNPFPKQDGVAVNRFHSSPTLISPSSARASEQHQQQHLLAKPSQLTFKIGPKCEADVSLEYIICRNLRNRRDLPKKQPSFDGFQHAIFISISGDGNGDIRLEDFKSLFPNLVALSITDSPGSAASLINLENTGTSSKWEARDPLIPKSLLQDPHFAKRFNLSPFSSTNSLLQRSTQSADVVSGGSRGERALILHDDHRTGNKSFSNASSSATTSTTDASSPGNSNKVGENMPEGDYMNDNDISSVESNDIFSPNNPVATKGTKTDNPAGGNGAAAGSVDDAANIQMDDSKAVAKPPEMPHKLRRLVWPSIRMLNLSSNQLKSEALPDILGNIFPNLEKLDLSNNYFTTLDRLREADWDSLQFIDISGNPLDCTNLEWIESASINLLQANETLCDQPPHQNKAKPIFKVLHLLKKVREECRVNCSCDIAYIWEQNHVVHSKIVVNCSGKGFLDFPNPKDLPQPTDTLDLRNNKITSMATFVDDQRYLELHVMNLYLDDNQITSINLLEGSDWFYQFQLFSIRRNDLTEVPVYVLENVFRQNPRLLQIDLSSNKFRCDCSTVSSFKVWLLKYSNQIGNIDDVRCANTNEQIRYMRMEQWCQMDNGTQYIDVLDLVSIVLAILIVAVVSKVYYDYWNFKTKGKLPWLVGKM